MWPSKLNKFALNLPNVSFQTIDLKLRKSSQTRQRWSHSLEKNCWLRCSSLWIFPEMSGRFWRSISQINVVFRFLYLIWSDKSRSSPHLLTNRHLRHSGDAPKCMGWLESTWSSNPYTFRGLNGSGNHSMVVFRGVRLTRNTIIHENMVFRVHQMPWNRYLSHKKSVWSSTGSYANLGSA